jgi:hypothetical protein
VNPTPDTARSRRPLQAILRQQPSSYNTDVSLAHSSIRTGGNRPVSWVIAGSTDNRYHIRVGRCSREHCPEGSEGDSFLAFCCKHRIGGNSVAPSLEQPPYLEETPGRKRLVTMASSSFRDSMNSLGWSRSDPDTVTTQSFQARRIRPLAYARSSRRPIARGNSA